jgi:hypothetical protein
VCLKSEMRRLWFLAVLLCLWPFAAQAHTRAPFSFVPEPPQKPSFSLRLEKAGLRQESPSLLTILCVSPDGRIGIFCGGDPIDHFDSDGRCIDGAANYLYNGGVAGQVLRGVGGYLDSYNNSSAGGGYLTGAAGSLIDELAGISAPSTYVNGLSSFGNNINTVYQSDGYLAAGSYAATSWNVGAVWSGAANINLATGEPVGDAYQRWTDVSSGVASTAGIAAGGLSVYNWATAPTTTTPTVVAPTDDGWVEQQQQQQQTGPAGATPTGPLTVDPGTLRLPPTRSEGADLFKLSQQMQQYGDSTEGMPPIQVTQGLNGEFMINDGVTRATRINTYNQMNSTVNQVPVIVIEQTAQDFGGLPTVARPR